MITRRDMMKGTAALAGGLALPGTLEAGIASAAQAASSGPARGVDKNDLALVNGKFVDGRGNVTTALTIKNGRITSIGSAAKPAADLTTIDLRGRTVVPGLFDSHVHYARAGVNPGYEARGIERAFSIVRTTGGHRRSREDRSGWGVHHVHRRMEPPPIRGRPSADEGRPGCCCAGPRRLHFGHWRRHRCHHEQTRSDAPYIPWSEGRRSDRPCGLSG